MSSREQDIRTELESHRADLRDEFLHSGMTVDQAEAKVAEVFGDLEECVQNTLVVQPHSRAILHPFTWLMLFSSASTFFTGLAFLLLQGTAGQLAVEKALVWSSFFCLMSLGLTLSRFLLEYFGLKQVTVLYASLTLSLLMSFSLTGLLDLNNFEVTIHLIGLAVFLGIGLHIWWNKLSLQVKYLSLFAFSAVATFSALTERPLFQFLGELRCLFIQPTTTPLTGALATCQQLPLWHPVLLVLYAVVLGGGIYLLSILWKYIRNNATSLFKKIILTASVSSLGIAPMLLPDLNKFGEMDIIPWKIEIYEAYDEILGREPEIKDIQFYASSKAYLDMYRLKEVLYQSDERKLKIDLLYQEVLHRHATPEEVEYFAAQKLSVDQIRQLLQTP